MAITFNSATSMYKCDTAAGSLFTTNKVLERIIYIPSAAGDDLVFKDSNGGTDMIVLKAGASDASPIQLHWPEGKRVPGMYMSTIDGGTAYVYLK
jgi:hypothetical protein